VSQKRVIYALGLWINRTVLIRFMKHMAKIHANLLHDFLGSRCDGAQRGEMPNPPKRGMSEGQGVGFKLLLNVKHKSLVKLITG